MDLTLGKQNMEMKKNSITKHDLDEAARISGGSLTADAVKAAFLERSGNISIIRK